MNALRPVVHTLSIHVRRLCCCLLDHPYKILCPDKDDLWLSGDRKPQNELSICMRCFNVKRRISYGKNARI